MPYQPFIQDQRGDLYAQGISQLGSGLAGGINAIAERQEKQKDEDKRRARQYDAMVELLDTSGLMTKEQAKVKSADQLEGILRGSVLKKEIDRQKLQDDELARNLRETYQKKQADAGFNQAVQNHLVEQNGKPPDPSTIYGFATQAGKSPAEINQIFEGLKHGGFIPEQKEPVLPLGRVVNVPGLGDWIGNGGPSPHWNPLTDKSKNLTEAQQKASLAVDLMSFDENVIKSIGDKGFDPTSNGVAFGHLFPKSWRTEGIQTYDDAQSNWINSVLRPQSGMTLTPKEEANAKSEYFPIRGETKEQVQIKFDRRQTALKNFMRNSGMKTPSQDSSSPTMGSNIKFDTEAAARAAGYKSGDSVKLYDPATARYRTAQLD